MFWLALGSNYINHSDLDLELHVHTLDAIEFGFGFCFDACDASDWSSPESQIWT